MLTLWRGNASIMVGLKLLQQVLALESVFT
jgi:hypothetical protein